MPLEEKKKHISSTTQPLVSIITPLYNAAPFIIKTIQSVLDQTYQKWELLIVDDASSDIGPDLVLDFVGNDKRIKFYPNKINKGAAHCRNLATTEATGEYIAFLDSDDVWHREKLEKQLRFMQAKDSDVSFTSYLHIDEYGNSLHKRVEALPILPYKKQHKNNYIGNLTGMYHVKKLGKIIAPNIRKRQDWAVWLEAIKKSGKPALGLQEDLASYRVREDSMSANKWKLISYNFDFYKTYLGYSWLKSLGCLLQFFWEYFFIRPKYIKTM
ncbi:MAG: teichuronic acid biosynthesis glycosyltransferase TuaG [Patiriisocius sp.]|jgi:teichuronic acid biosynthesis glycosyltransferase TuaG